MAFLFFAGLILIDTKYSYLNRKLYSDWTIIFYSLASTKRTFSLLFLTQSIFTSKRLNRSKETRKVIYVKKNFPFHEFLSFSLMKIGYARISTDEQNLDLQEDALQEAGCEKIIVDRASGKNTNRPGLESVKTILRKGDTLVVWRLDRLGRSLKDLIEWMSHLENEGVGFVSLQESINTSTPTGKLVFHLFGALAEFERNLILERTKAGLAAARARGGKGGRPPTLSLEQKRILVDLYKGWKHTIKDLCAMFGVSKPTLYTYVREMEKRGK